MSNEELAAKLDHARTLLFRYRCLSPRENISAKSKIARIRRSRSPFPRGRERVVCGFVVPLVPSVVPKSET